MKKPYLKRCPFCGAPAKFHEIKEGDNEGSEYIECSQCHASTSLMYPLMDDVKELLAEKWNKRV